MGAEHTLCPSCGSVQYDKMILKACTPWESAPQNTLCNSDIFVSIRICKSCGTMYVSNMAETAKDCLKNTLALSYGVPTSFIGEGKEE